MQSHLLFRKYVSFKEQTSIPVGAEDPGAVDYLGAQ